jgi:hypothetical protein
MKKVIIESPFAGDIDAHITYARRAMRDSLLRNEAPLASHLLYAQSGVLNDNEPKERNQGIEAGLLWGKHADLTAVYTDYGVSKGMQIGIERAQQENRPIEYRTIEKKTNNLTPLTK